MPRLRFLAALLLAAGCATSPATQGPAPVPSTWAQDEAEIRAAIASSAAGWNEASLDKHLALYDSSVTFMTKAGPRPGIEPIRQAFSRTYFNGDKPKQALSFKSVTVRPLGRDAALANGNFILSGGGLPEQSGWFTLVWLRTANGWKAVHDHSS